MPPAEEPREDVKDVAENEGPQDAMAEGEGAAVGGDDDGAPGRFAVHDRRFWAREGEARDDAPPRAAKPAYVEELEARLAEQDERLKQTIEAHRAAERRFAEARERLGREQAKEIEREKAALVARFFDVMDNMDRSLEAADAVGGAPPGGPVGSGPAGGPAGSGPAAGGPGALEALRDGVRIVHRQLVDVLAGLGLERIDPAGEPFDPNEHDAMSLVPVADADQDNVVQTVFRCGYRSGDQVLRPATVIVGRFAPPSQSETGPDDA